MMPHLPEFNLLGMTNKFTLKEVFDSLHLMLACDMLKKARLLCMAPIPFLL